jgi:SAM-dependent methyltransferase
MPSERSEWEDLPKWWEQELAGDPAYEEEVTPLMVDLLDPPAGGLLLDVGCGEGRLIRVFGSDGRRIVGVDLLQDLLVAAPRPVVRLRLPGLESLRTGSFEGAYVCLVLEHLPEERPLFDELARVLRAGAPLAVVVNHPVFTAPGSAPIQEVDEVLWRPGNYFGRGFSDEPVGGGIVRFYHRPMSDLLTSAAAAGFNLERVVEVAVSEAQVARTPVLGGQRHIPRLLGLRCTRSST